MINTITEIQHQNNLDENVKRVKRQREEASIEINNKKRFLNINIVVQHEALHAECRSIPHQGTERVR